MNPGVTIILTTHYIEEAEEMADRVGVINHGKIIIVEDKKILMRKLGTKQLSLDLHEPLAAIPEELQAYDLTLSPDRTQLVYAYDSNKEDNGIAELLNKLSASHVRYKDIHTQESSLEDIFVNLVKRV